MRHNVLIARNMTINYAIETGVSDPYSFFPDPDPDPEVEAGDQYGSGSGSRALMTKNWKK